MQGKPTRVRREDIWRVERAVVLQVLRDDHTERWSLEELLGELSDYGPGIVDEALARMEREGILEREGRQVWASRAARHLDELELIGI
jgi:hypothetical protein